MWYGAIVNIPAGWILCDGNGGSPDLRNRFIIGAGISYNPDDKGGAVQHTHTFTGDGHTHTIPAGPQIAAGTSRANTTFTTPATGTTDNKNHLPPYYALAYIMKT